MPPADQGERERVTRDIIARYCQLPAYQRPRCQWVMSQATSDWLAELFTDPPPDDDDQPPDPGPLTTQASLLGVPITIRDNTPGIQLEVLPSGSTWACQQVSAKLWLHERWCPHVDWTQAPDDGMGGAINNVPLVG